MHPSSEKRARLRSKFVLALARGRLDDAKERATELIDFSHDAKFPWVSIVYSWQGMVELWQGANESFVYGRSVKLMG